MVSFATSEATKKYKKNGISQYNIHPSHFKTAHGLHLSSIGLGTYLGQPTAQVDKLVERAVKKCIRSGAVNVIDTAINYRNHRAERSIGRALHELFRNNEVEREQIFISTKNGYIAPRPEDNYSTISEYMYEEIINQHICKKEHIVDGIHSMCTNFLEFQLNQSLSNLQLDSIDLLYLHNAAESQLPVITPDEFYDRLLEAFNFFERMRDIRKIRWYGLATWDCFRVFPSHEHYLNLEKVVTLAKKAGGEEHGLRFIQAPLNVNFHQLMSLQNQFIENRKYTTIEAATKLGVKIFASASLLQGQVLQSSIEPKFPLLMTKAQQALQYTRSSDENVISALVGMKKEEHIKENLKVAKVPLATKEEIEKAFE